MAHELKARDLVLRLLDGRSEQRVVVLEAGVPRPPFSMGGGGAWTVDTGHGAAQRVILAFNGWDLYVCAVGGHLARLDGEPIGRRWVIAPVPCELRFGRARVAIRTRGDDAESVSPLAQSRRALDLEARTSIDERRLAEALRLSMGNDAGMPATAEVDVPVVAPRAPRATGATPLLPPLRRPVVRAIVPIAHFQRSLDSRSE